MAVRCIQPRRLWVLRLHNSEWPFWISHNFATTATVIATTTTTTTAADAAAAAAAAAAADDDDVFLKRLISIE